MFDYAFKTATPKQYIPNKYTSQGYNKYQRKQQTEHY